MQVRISFLLVVCLSCLMVLGGEDDAKRQDSGSGPVHALEGILKVHPKYLFTYYITGFGDGQECALFGQEKLKGIRPGSRVRVEGRLGTRFHEGGTEDNPSPFPPTCFIYMDVEEVRVLSSPTEDRIKQEPLSIQVPESIVAVTDAQKKLAEGIKTLSRGMSKSEVKERLGQPTSESSRSLTYYLIEDRIYGGFDITARLVFDDHGLVAVRVTQAHETRIPRFER